jgi:hypothetical protein
MASGRRTRALSLRRAESDQNLTRSIQLARDPVVRPPVNIWDVKTDGRPLIRATSQETSDIRHSLMISSSSHDSSNDGERNNKKGIPYQFVARQ